MAKLQACVLLIFACVVLSEGFNYPKLRLLNVIFRHGDRMPNDKPEGDLSNVGRRKSFKFGEVLRSRYGDFLGDYYVGESVSSLSTAYVRAKMSLQLVLAGLYPPKGYQKWHESLDWQPIPYNQARLYDDILLMPQECPVFKREIENVKKTTDYRKQLEPYRELMKNLSALTGQKFETFYDMFALYHKLDAQRSINQTLPDWSAGIFPDGALLEATYSQYDVLRYNDWMARINGGTLIRKVTNDMLNSTSKDPSPKKLFLYSGHEMTIVAVLKTLKIWRPHIPEYSSAVVLELREESSNYYVKVMYYSGSPLELVDHEIPGCQSLCPLAKFIALISDQLPDPKEIICTERDEKSL